MMRKASLFAILLCVGMLPVKSHELPGDKPQSMPNIVAPTLGGTQFWADVTFFHQWRIQRHVGTDHYRLLNPSGWREAWGSYDACMAELNDIRKKNDLPPMKGKAVVLLHGLGRTHRAMKSLAKTLREQGDYQVFNVEYPTMMGNVGQHAQSLDRVINSLDGIEQIHFVGHSLGNLVVRRWLHDTTDKTSGKPREQARLGRMVMLAPPNQRPELASKVGQLKIARMIGGPAFRELSTGWDELAPTLATPPFEFGIIAGGRSTETGYNPLVPGDDDGVVSVASTKLPGAADFRLLPLTHTFIMNDDKVQEFTLRFLKHGYFENRESRTEIGADE